MRILHLSDIHLGSSEFLKSQKMFDKIIDAIMPLHNDEPIDVVVCTGDLINQGGGDYEGGAEALFEIFRNIIITPLMEKLNLPKERFVFCPGNHDVNRSADSQYSEKGLDALLKTEEDITQLIRSERCSDEVKRMIAFKEFEKKYYSSIAGLNYQYGFFDSSLIMDINGVSVGFSLLNSAWRCWDSKKDKNKILIGQEQIIHSLTHIADCQIKVALSHHDTTWLADFDAPIILKHICQNYDMYFTGHTHSSNECYQIKPEGSTFNIVAPGVLSANIGVAESQYKNGFSVIDYDIVNYQFHSRLFYQEGITSFNLDKNHGTDGVWTIDVPVGEDAKKKREIVSLVMDIRDNAERTNEHLLSYKTNSCAPKSVTQIFVEPLLSKRVLTEDESESPDKEPEIESINLSEILASDENYILFGIRESGKTILLDKLMIDASLHVGGCTDIPAIINFKDIHGNIEATINTYWQHDYRMARSILQTEKVLLLIDNIDFSDNKRLEILNDFLASHTNVRYIGTCLTARGQDDNLDVYNQPVQNFVRVEIEQFKSRQIRELITKWISSGQSESEVQKRVDAIVEAFAHLNLPRTPFAISMFLWILERQESYKPQNNAILIKAYIENLLQGGNNTASREEFDYINQSTVLSEIAYAMLKEDNANYAIKSSTAIKIIEDNLEEFHFRKVYSANAIYNNFLKNGLFTQEPDNMVRFRFSCFFEYFLYLRMEKNGDFLNEVLNDENYLKFYNEIVYYTGINRGDDIIIKKIMEDLEYDYIEINNIVFQQVSNIDDFFNVGSSLLQRIKPADLMRVLPDKETTKENDARNDAVLQKKAIPNDEDAIKRKNSNKFNNFSRLLLLAMDVLRNCEEFKSDPHNPNATKKYYYDLVLRNSISYAILFKLIAVEMVNHEDKFPKERVEDLKFIVRLLPVLHEELLRGHLGTYKLTEVIKDKIEEDNKLTSNPSEFERFLSVFLYADLKGKDYFSVLSEFLKNFRRAYIADASYFKLLSYYYSSKVTSDDNKLINLLGDLYVKLNTTSSTRINKSAVIASLKSKKKINEIGDRNSSK